MKKNDKNKIIHNYQTNVSQTSEILCSQCKEIIIFIENQDSKLCPNCGNLVFNKNNKNSIY